jgi:hypothetical protein
MDVAAWLRGLGLEQYTSAFHDNAIDGEVLRELTADDLKDLGVTLVGHRRRLLAAITALGNEASTLAQSAASATSAPISPPSIDAERRQLTVMFCDLVGALLRGGACPLVEASTDPDGGWHTKACHPVQHVASNLCFDLLTGQSPGEESPSNDGFVPIHCSLNEASPVVTRTTLPADATMLFDRCNMLIALRRLTRTRYSCRPRWNDDVSLRVTISHSVVDSLTIICAVCYQRCDRGAT